MQQKITDRYNITDIPFENKKSFSVVPAAVMLAIFNTEFIYLHLCVTAVNNRETKQIKMKILFNSLSFSECLYAFLYICTESPLKSAALEAL